MAAVSFSGSSPLPLLESIVVFSQQHLRYLVRAELLWTLACLHVDCRVFCHAVFKVRTLCIQSSNAPRRVCAELPDLTVCWMVRRRRGELFGVDSQRTTSVVALF